MTWECWHRRKRLVRLIARMTAVSSQQPRSPGEKFPHYAQADFVKGLPDGGAEFGFIEGHELEWGSRRGIGWNQMDLTGVIEVLQRLVENSTDPTQGRKAEDAWTRGNVCMRGTSGARNLKARSSARENRSNSGWPIVKISNILLAKANWIVVALF